MPSLPSSDIHAYVLTSTDPIIHGYRCLRKTANISAVTCKSPGKLGLRHFQNGTDHAYGCVVRRRELHKQKRISRDYMVFVGLPQVSLKLRTEQYKMGTRRSMCPSCLSQSVCRGLL
ncbi:uncharacterized protein LOC135366159 isoform X2 [Ornithodoros turicata]